MKPATNQKPTQAQESIIRQTVDAVQVAGRALGFTLDTRKAYGAWAARFGAWLCGPGRAHRNATPAEKIREFLLWIANGGDNGRKKSAISLKQARHALLFLYQKVRRVDVGDIGIIPSAKLPTLLPDVRTPEEVAAVIAAIEDSEHTPYRLITAMLYYTGARIRDVLSLRIKDLDWGNSEVVFRCGKGRKDRRVRIPCCVMTDLRQQMQVARARYNRDQSARPRVPIELPESVWNKAPNYGFSWGWYYLFPAATVGINPDTKIPNRWRVNEGNLQSVVRVAARKVGLDGVLTPHKLRHVYSTQLLREGVDIRTVQEMLGHEDVKTTEIYTHTMIRAPRTVDAVERIALRVPLSPKAVPEVVVPFAERIA